MSDRERLSMSLFTPLSLSLSLSPSPSFLLNAAIFVDQHKGMVNYKE